MNKSCSVSSVFSTARIYALLSIVSAHFAYVGTFSFVILNRFGTIGVIAFLIMAGYFFKTEKFASFGVLLKKKAVSLCIPWLFLGTLTWCYNAILVPNNRGILQYLKWIFGNGSYLYYMPMLLLCFILMYKAPKWCRFIAIGLNVLSILLTASGLLKPILEYLNITNYLNVFNWIGFFAFGMLLQDISEEKLTTFFIKSRFWFISAFLIVFSLIIIFNNIPADYFSFIAIPYEMIGAFAIFGLSTFSLTKFSVFRQLSNCSFSIYLVHIIFIGLLDGVMDNYTITQLLSPVVTIFLMFILFAVAISIFDKLKMNKLLAIITGIRN